MGGVLLGAQNNTGFSRTTVHQQYNGEALGFFMLNHLVPIVLNVRQPGGTYKKVILVWRKLTQKYIPYSDMGIIEKCCRRVFLFNIRHYLKCYLPTAIDLNGDPTEPFTYNLCQKCGASVVDGHGHTLQYITRRSYRGDSYIYRTSNRLQNDTSGLNIGYQERAETC